MVEENCIQFDCTPPELRELALRNTERLLPPKSKPLYDAEYKKFNEFCRKHEVKQITENVVYSYFVKLSENYAPTSLQSKYSFLKKTLQLYSNIDISQFKKINSLLKRESENHDPKKAKVLTEEELETFLESAPNQIYLAVKVVAIFALMGALRCEEIVNIQTEDIEDLQTIFLVKILVNKSKIPKSFTIYSSYYDIVKQYYALPPANVKSTRFFLNYQQEKCTVQPIGKNKIAYMPRRIAEYLKLPNPEQYTGHSFRRSSASIVANAGADTSTLQRLGKWKSSAIAESYVEESLHSKNRIASIIESRIKTVNPTETLALTSSPEPVKKFKFTPKTPILCTLPKPSPLLSTSPIQNENTLQQDYSVTNDDDDAFLSLDLNNYIVEDFIDSTVSSQVQQNVIPNPNEFRLPNLPNNYTFNNCTVTFNIRN